MDRLELGAELVDRDKILLDGPRSFEEAAVLKQLFCELATRLATELDEATATWCEVRLAAVVRWFPTIRAHTRAEVTRRAHEAVPLVVLRSDSEVASWLDQLGAQDALREEVAKAAKKPECATCGDTHVMTLSKDGDVDQQVPCTRCPVPCQECRLKGTGAYCSKIPCDCWCHKRPRDPDRERREASRIDARSKKGADWGALDRYANRGASPKKEG